jgi:hypothetical protein
MKIREVVQLLSARLVTGENQLEREISHAFSSDLVSDVLTIEMSNVLLISGLANIQTIRTAEMSDIRTIFLARNKKASHHRLEKARQNNIVLIEFNGYMFQTTGILYNAGNRHGCYSSIWL